MSEAAKILGISREALRQRIRRNSIEAEKVDGVWYVYLDSVKPQEGDSVGGGWTSTDGSGNRTPNDIATGMALNLSIQQAIQNAIAPLIAEVAASREEVRSTREAYAKAQEDAHNLHIDLERMKHERDEALQRAEITESLVQEWKREREQKEPPKKSWLDRLFRR
jgi:hypothetical protein